MPSISQTSSEVTIRTEAKMSDSDAVREIVASTGFFSKAEIDVAVELIEDRLQRGSESDYRFIFADVNGSAAGYACYGPIACTVGSFDLYWIAVHAASQGLGIGKRLMSEVERAIAADGGRHIYVETSSRPQYQSTRDFYVACGYGVAAIFPDFYDRGDGKVVYVKMLN